MADNDELTPTLEMMTRSLGAGLTNALKPNRYFLVITPPDADDEGMTMISNIPIDEVVELMEGFLKRHKARKDGYLA